MRVLMTCVVMLLAGCSASAGSPASSGTAAGLDATVSPSTSQTEPSLSPRGEPDATPAGTRECPTGVPTLAAVIAVRSDYRSTCFGGDELVLQGWTWDDQGAYDCHVQSGPPRWLVCTAEHARLTTAAYEPGDPAQQPIDPADGPFRVAFDPDGAAAAALGPNHWVEVRGRFGDPITDSCDAIVDAAFAAECRSAFVAYAARVIESPR